MSSFKKGRFIVFEGIDGSGKSTQLNMIAKRLADEGHDVHATFEPSEGPVGRLIRKMLSGEVPTDQRTIAALFAADRTDHLVNEKNGIAGKVRDGKIVLCDRYYFSSYAYQSQHLDMEWVIGTNAVVAEILRPDMTIFIDVDPDMCFQRIKAGRNSLEMYEKVEIMKQVRENYFKAFDRLKDVEKIAVIDGTRSVESVEETIYKEISKLLDIR